MPNHPIRILIDQISYFFQNQKISDIVIKDEKFRVYQDFSPLVTTDACFDKLFIPKDHVSRAPTDTFYTDPEHCLRPHTSVHQIPIMERGGEFDGGQNAFLVVGDVYRKDTVDRTHYPAFHQMEGVRIYDFADIGASNKEQAKEICKRDLQ